MIVDLILCPDSLSSRPVSRIPLTTMCLLEARMLWSIFVSSLSFIGFGLLSPLNLAQWIYSRYSCSSNLEEVCVIRVKVDKDHDVLI